MSNLCSVLEALHKNPDSDSESDDDNIDDADDPLNGSGNSRLSPASSSWRGSLQKLPTTPSTSESDLANLSADSDVCRQCGQCTGSAGLPHWARRPRGGRAGRSRERGRGSDRESERESDRESVGGCPSGYGSDRPPLPSRSRLKEHASRTRSRRPSGGPSPSPTSTCALHVHTCSLDTDCSSDQDKHSDSSAADVVSTGGLLRNKRTSRKSNKSVGFAEDPPHQLPPPSLPSPRHQAPPSPQPLPPPPPPQPHPQGPPSSPLPERTNLFRPISKPSPGPLKANHELLRLVPTSAQRPALPSPAAKDREFRPVRRVRARSRSSDGSCGRGDRHRAGREGQTGSEQDTGSEANRVLSRVRAIEALALSGRGEALLGNCTQPGVDNSGSGRGGGGAGAGSAFRDSGDSTAVVNDDDDGADKGGKDGLDSSSVRTDWGRRRAQHVRPRSASTDRRKQQGLTVAAARPGAAPLFTPSPASPVSSVTPSPSSTPSPGYHPAPGFPPPPDSALPRYDEAVERVKLLRWASLQQLSTSRGVSGTCGGRAESQPWRAGNDSNEGSDDVFTSDDDVRPGDSDVSDVASSGRVRHASQARLQSRRTSSSKRIVLEVLV